MAQAETLQISPLTRTDALEGDVVSVTIYRVNQGGWRLRATNTRGVSFVWRKHFETEAEAMEAYVLTLEQDGLSFIKRAGMQLDVMDGFNPRLLAPRDKKYTDPTRFAGYTLRVLKPIHAYSGIWPVQSLLGHNVSGYLYRGQAPSWPHPCKGLPGAPDNIDVEFTIAPDYIEAEVVHDLGLRPAISNYFNR